MSVNVFWLFCDTMMALQVMFSCLGPFPQGFSITQWSTRGHNVTLLLAWFTTAVKYVFEYLTNHEECLPYVAIICFEVVLRSMNLLHLALNEIFKICFRHICPC